MQADRVLYYQNSHQQVDFIRNSNVVVYPPNSTPLRSTVLATLDFITTKTEKKHSLRLPAVFSVIIYIIIAVVCPSVCLSVCPSVCLCIYLRENGRS